MTVNKQKQRYHQPHQTPTNGDLVHEVTAPVLGPPGADDKSVAVERLRWQLNRAEGWIVSADGKATIILGLNGALIAGVLAVDPGAVEKYLSGGWVSVPFAIVFLAAVIYSCWQAALAVLPNLGTPKSGGSIWHFEDVNTLSLNEFHALVMELNQETELTALGHQIYTVSKIAASKYHRLRRSVYSLIVAVTTGATILLVHDVLLSL